MSGCSEEGEEKEEQEGEGDEAEGQDDSCGFIDDETVHRIDDWRSAVWKLPSKVPYAPSATTTAPSSCLGFGSPTVRMQSSWQHAGNMSVGGDAHEQGGQAVYDGLLGTNQH